MKRMSKVRGFKLLRMYECIAANLDLAPTALTLVFSKPTVQGRWLPTEPIARCCWAVIVEGRKETHTGDALPRTLLVTAKQPTHSNITGSLMNLFECSF